MDHRDYRIIIEPLATEDGGGFLATVPDLPGCMSDGETRESAARNISDAIALGSKKQKFLGAPFHGRHALRKTEARKKLG